MVRILELIRVSTDGQKDRGTHETQRHDLDQLRVKRPGVLVERIEALGVSGAKGAADRPDLQRLLELSKKKAYDELRVWNVDRLTRSEDPRERFAIFGAAQDAGAVIVDCNGRVIDPNDESGMGELDYYLQTLFSARERKKFLARTNAARKVRASQGRLSQGVAPFGRVLNRHTMQWEVVDHEFKAYRRLIELVLEGRSTRAVAKQLDTERVLPPKGTKWAVSTIKRLIHQPTIVGEYRTCGSLTQIPPVATRDEWARLKAKLSGNVSRPAGTPPRSALLRGLLHCHACGMRVHVESDGAGAVARYGCPRPSRRETKCPNRHTLRVPTADESVRKALVEFMTNPTRLAAALKAGRAGVRRQEKVQRDTAAELEKLTQRETRTLALLHEGLLSDDAGRRELVAIKAARKALEEQPAPEPRPNPAALELSAETLARAVASASPARLRELLAILVPPGGLRLTARGVQIDGVLPLSTGAGDTATASTCCAHRPPRAPARP